MGNWDLAFRGSGVGFEIRIFLGEIGWNKMG